MTMDNTMTEHDINIQDFSDLKDEALSANDMELYQKCLQAIAGDISAQEECARVVKNNRFINPKRRKTIKLEIEELKSQCRYEMRQVKELQLELTAIHLEHKTNMESLARLTRELNRCVKSKAFTAA